jgi:hypothetical protein
LDGLPDKIVGYLFLFNNPLSSLRGINKLKEMDGPINLERCPITSHILGVFLIKGCDSIYPGMATSAFGKAADIVNQHIGKGRAGLLICTHELIEAGLSDFAQI